MVYDVIMFLVGLALVIAGGNYVTDGASAIARRFRVSPLLIGVTVVAFGSSMPDLVVCLSSTLKGHSELALGDVVGANIIDIYVVIGIVALVRPLQIGDMTRWFDMPMLALSCLAMYFCGDDMVVNGAVSNSIDRSEGLMLLSAFVVYIAMSVYLSVTTARTADAAPSQPAADTSRPLSMPVATGMVVLALGALVVGGNWFVDGASGIAGKAGLSEGLVGLTIVSLGSAAPDIATSVIATLKHQPGIAIGNVLGACIFNVFFIIGLCGVIEPLNATTIATIDFGTLAIGGVTLCLLGIAARRVGRVAGIVMLAVYAAYLTKLVCDFVA